MNIDRSMALGALKCEGFATAVCDFCSRILSGPCKKDMEVTYVPCGKGLNKCAN